VIRSEPLRKISVVVLLVLFLSLPRAIRAADLPDDSETAAPANAAASAPAAPAKGKGEGGIPVGIGVKVSSLGIGGEAALALTHRSNVRVGFNYFSYGDTFNKDGATYKGTLGLQSVQATYDVFLVSSFHVSPGVLLYNGNKVTANVSVPGGQSFTLNKVSYISDPADPVAGTGKLSVYKAAPMLLVGFGNLVPRSSRHFSASFDIGAAYQGPPRIILNLGGSACDPSGVFCRSISSDPTIQANIVAEQAKLNKSASPFRFYPVLSFGLGYKF
jgi:hypothetical protein